VVGELRTCEGFLNHVAVNTVNPLLPPDIGSYAPAPFKMTLLSARSHTCVHQPAINHKAGVDEGCRAANKDRSCNMKRTAKNLGSQLPSVWDVEDIVQIGTVRRACPYFASKEALLDAQLVLVSRSLGIAYIYNRKLA
jgi:DEAD_2